jgi:hypothetical protein
MKRQYASYQETIDYLQQAMVQHPDLIRVESIGDTWENRPIMMVTISKNLATSDQKPAMLYTGSIHAREWIGNELALKFIQYTIEHHKYNPKYLSALRSSTLYIVPCLNPDGFEYSRSHFSFWRKNRRDNGDGTFGVDLNRNFSECFKKGTETSSTTYAGPSAFSEPETSAIKQFVESHQNISIALDYHSQGNVFFPAHNYRHESEIEGTDLNVLCANMNREISKVTGRKYGIHRGKPPFNLINGSGREYYYARGILAVVVEVGTRNIPDYMKNMSSSIDENIPAILYAFSEVKNYAKNAPQRVENFTIDKLTASSVSLSWQCDQNADIHFEIYRSQSYKSACCDETLVAITHENNFTDRQLKSGQRYFYNIRAIDGISELKSPFSPEVKLKTLLSDDEFSRGLFPIKKNVGFLQQVNTDKNPAHFGHNSLFIGVSRSKGICYGVIEFSLRHLADDIKIKSAIFSLYPMNRVAAKIENYGEWSISLLKADSITDINDFEQVHQAEVIHTLGHIIESDKLTQGIWCEWRLNGIERALLSEQIKVGKIILRIQGPTQLPLGQDSQVMQFDIGHGSFGGGIHYRPNFDIIYTVPAIEVELKPSVFSTISPSEINSQCLRSGFDNAGRVVYGQMAFSLADIPNSDKTVITEVYLLMHNKNSIDTEKDIRFTIELAELKDLDYESVMQRQKIEFIGYEVSNAMLKKKNQHYFIFDSYCRQHLVSLHSTNKVGYLIIRATAVSKEINALIDWHCGDNEEQPCLIVKYIKRRKIALDPPTQLTSSIENKMLRLDWKNPDDKDFVGSYVVRNRFHPPTSPFDGVKLYAGKDEYTYDKLGNMGIAKYYSVFSYDNVPNYSSPCVLHYSIESTIGHNDFVDYDGLPQLLNDYGLDDEDLD